MQSWARRRQHAFLWLVAFAESPGSLCRRQPQSRELRNSDASIQGHAKMLFSHLKTASWKSTAYEA